VLVPVWRVKLSVQTLAPMASQSHFNSYQAHTTGESPSVPLSVYRDLAGELQATRALASVLKGKNQQLQQHNRELQHEIETLAAITDRIRTLAQRSEKEFDPQEVSLPMLSLSAENSASEALDTNKANEVAFPTPVIKLASVAETSPELTPEQGEGWGFAAITLAIALLFASLGFMALRPVTSPQAPQQQSHQSS